MIIMIMTMMMMMMMMMVSFSSLPETGGQRGPASPADQRRGRAPSGGGLSESSPGPASTVRRLPSAASRLPRCPW